MRILNLGGGLQSSCIAEMIVEGKIASVDLVIFADTGDEPAYVYQQVGYLFDRLNSVGIELCVVSAGSIARDTMDDSRSRFAAIPVYTRDRETGKIGMMRRQCTREYKVAPINQEIKRRLLGMGHAKADALGRVYVNRGYTVHRILGISRDEAERMSDPHESWATHEYPLVDLCMSRQDCANWLSRRGLPVPGKSSCNICPFHHDLHWREMRDNRPEDWRQVVEFDRKLREPARFVATARGEMYLHSSLRPLDEVDLDTSTALPLFEMCGAYCFV